MREGIEHREGEIAPITKAVLRIMLSACCTPVALVMEFLLAGLFNWIGFAWPLRLLLGSGENVYWFLVKRGFYVYPSGLLADMNFALKIDLAFNFLLFVWLYFSFPGLLKRWIPLKVSQGES